MKHLSKEEEAMERKSWKLWVLVVIAITIVLTIGAAGAEGSGRLKTKLPIPVRKRGVDFTGGSQAVTCEEKSWTIANDGFIEDGYYYEYSMGIKDGSYAEGYTDSMYTAQRVRTADFSTTFTYTFYEPGEYWLFAEKYASMDAYNPVETLYQCIMVTEGDHENPLTAAVAQAAAACLKDNDFATVNAINDYICDRVEYDYTYVHHSPESALLEGTGVCSSYSRAFKLIADACGLQCRRVTGTAGGGGHAWNVVMMDGQWYQMDLTWNDTGGDRHLYFGLTDTLIEHDHTDMYIVDGSGIVCNSMDNNCIIRNEEWKTRVGRGTYAAISNRIASGSAIEDVDFGYVFFSEGGDSFVPLVSEGVRVDQYWLYGNISAYAYSQETWAGPDGTCLKGPFTYDFDHNTLSATLSAVGDVLSIGNTQNKTTFETGEAFSFLARYITNDATGVTLRAEVFEKEETTAAITKTSDTNQGEFEFQIWDDGEYSLVISAVRDGTVLASEQIEFSVSGVYHYFDAHIPAYWQIPLSGAPYVLRLDYGEDAIVPDLADVYVYRNYDELLYSLAGVRPENVSIEIPIQKGDSFRVRVTNYKQGYRVNDYNMYGCRAVLGTLSTPTLTLPENVTAGEPITVTVSEVPNADYYHLYISGPEYNNVAGYTTKYLEEAGEYELEQYGLDGGEYSIQVSARSYYDYANSESATYTLNVTGERHPAPAVLEPAGTFTEGDTAWYTVTGEGMTAAGRDKYPDSIYQTQNGTAMVPIPVYSWENSTAFRGLFNGRWSEATEYYKLKGQEAEHPVKPDTNGPEIMLNPTAPLQGQNLWVGVTPVEAEGTTIYTLSFGKRRTYTWYDDEWETQDQIIYDMPFDISEGGVEIPGCNLLDADEYTVTVTVYSDLYGGWLCETSKNLTVAENPDLPQAPSVRLLTENNLQYGITKFEITTGGGADKIYAFINKQDDYGLEENPTEISIDPSETKYIFEWQNRWSGTYEAYFSVSRNGIWSDSPAAVVFDVTVSDEDLCADKALYYSTETAIGQPLTISWDPISKAEWFEAKAYVDDDLLYEGKLAKGSTSVMIDTSGAAHSGYVYFILQAYAPGYYGSMYSYQKIKMLDPRLKITATLKQDEDMANIVHLHLSNVRANRILVKIDGVVTGMYGTGPNNGTADLTLTVPSRTSQIQVANYDTNPRKWGAWSDPVKAYSPVLNPTKTLYLPANLTEIEANAFEGIDAEAVIIPDGCTKIGAGAFRGCQKLTYVSYKSGTFIGEGAFDGCAAELLLDPR